MEEIRDDVERATDLANYWDDRLDKKGASIFWEAVERAKGQTPLRDRKNMISYKDMIGDIATRIWRGEPLTFQEFHLAVAEYMLLTEKTYEDFFLNAWGENHKQYGIGVKGPTE